MDDSRSFERRLTGDLEALRQTTRHGLPDPTRTQRELRAALARSTQGAAYREPGPGQGPEPGGLLMTVLRTVSSRPRFVTALFGCALTAGILLVPVSYERTVGQIVTLHVAADALPPGGGRQLAQQARQALHAQSVQLRQAQGAPGAHPELTLVATLPTRSDAQAEQLAHAFVDKLRSAHVTATAEVKAKTVRTSGRVYAMALDKLISIRVETTGKSDAEVATEIRNQLETGGVHGAAVSFERHGDEAQMQIDADVDGRQLKVMRQTKGGPSELQIDIGGIDDTREPGMTDDQLRDKITRQLVARGLDPTVTVTGDRIEVRAHKRVDPGAK